EQCEWSRFRCGRLKGVAPELVKVGNVHQEKIVVYHRSGSDMHSRPRAPSGPPADLDCWTGRCEEPLYIRTVVLPVHIQERVGECHPVEPDGVGDECSIRRRSPESLPLLRRHPGRFCGQWFRRYELQSVPQCSPPFIDLFQVEAGKFKGAVNL